MSLLASERRAVSLSQVLSFMNESESIPANACLVTIDDGMRSTLTEASPILQKYNIPAVAFVSSNLVGRELEDLPEAYLNQEELRTLNECPQVTIGSHAHTHRSMGELSITEMSEEATRSKALLTEYVGTTVNAFAYPFGMQRDFNAETDAALRAAGYDIAFTSMHGPVTRHMEPISLPRVKIEGGESLAMFAKISCGAMDNWRLIDDHMWRVQRVRREIS